MTIPQSFIDELLARLDVVEIVGRYVPLKKAGANFMGLCPFHSEKSPSFSVSPAKQFYHCFGCGASGDAIRFLMKHAGMGFVEAVKELAGQVGLQVPEDPQSPRERALVQAARSRQLSLLDVMEKAATAYRKELKGAARAVNYLKRRGLSGEIARRFGLGYAPPGRHFLSGVFPAYDDPQLDECGLVVAAVEGNEEKRRYDRFRDRIMFPIRNVKGECIGFGGRVLGDEKPKYLNSPETPLFHKGRELYGLYEARQAIRETGYVLVTEGYMDVVALAQLGFAHAVATLGTACTSEHVQKLFRFSDAVVFSFDGDAAGRRAAHKALHAALPWVNDVRSVKFLFLPPEHDPDSFIRTYGSDAFAEQVAQAVALSRFLLDAAAEGCELDTSEGRARMASQARPLWSALPEGLLKRQLLGELAERLRLSATELGALWQAQAPSAHERPASRTKNESAYTPIGAGAAAETWPIRPHRRARRAVPTSRADHAARLLLAQMAHWDALSQEEQTLLCALPEPHGPLFVWLDRQFHEHGPLPWGALREDLPDAPWVTLAQQLMQSRAELAAPEGETDTAETRAELRSLMDLMLLDHLSALENDAVAQAEADPAALERLRALHERRRLIQLGLHRVGR